MKILSLDPATNCGFAFWDGHALSLVGFKVFPKTEKDGDRLLEVFRWTKEMIDTWKPDLVLAEGFFVSGRFANGVEVNFEIRGAIKMACAQRAVDHKVYTPSEWKKQLCGRTTPTKLEKKRYGKERAKKMVTVLKLQELGFKFPEKVTSITGRQVNFKFDTSDAIGILMAHLITNSIPYQISPDLFKVEAKN